jgi:hypothetical protein
MTCAGVFVTLSLYCLFALPLYVFLAGIVAMTRGSCIRFDLFILVLIFMDFVIAHLVLVGCETLTRIIQKF